MDEAYLRFGCGQCRLSLWPISGGVPRKSYCNFLISNGVVLGQKYWVPDAGMPETLREKDQQAEAVLTSVFPDRKVIMINTIPINFGGGGIHCSTRQEP